METRAKDVDITGEGAEHFDLDGTDRTRTAITILIRIMYLIAGSMRYSMTTKRKEPSRDTVCETASSSSQAPTLCVNKFAGKREESKW